MLDDHVIETRLGLEAPLRIGSRLGRALEGRRGGGETQRPPPLSRGGPTATTGEGERETGEARGRAILEEQVVF